MLDIESAKNSLNPLYIGKLVKYRIQFAREHPDYFQPDGLVIFVGVQGSGKSLSAVLYVNKLMKKYPKCILVTNLYLKNYPIDNERVFYFENSDSLSKYNNGEYGVIFLIDEIQLYFNSLESKNINPEVMVQISQQRKQRKHIVATSQVFGRMAKPLREQFSSVILCKNYFSFLQKNSLIDRDSIEDFDNGTNLSGKIKKNFWWIHNPLYYGMYDTYAIIERNKFISNEEKVVDIYDRNKLSSDNGTFDKRPIR